MIGYLICEDGPQVGLVIPLKDGNEWIIGRDPALSAILLEDPMVSRKHGLIRRDGDLFFLDNSSEVNPIKVNNETAESFPLIEDDTIQVGNNYFRFSLINPETDLIESEPKLEAPSILPFNMGSPARFFLKVLSGPNQGAEFGMNKGATYILGKDATADIIFQDLSVSHRHAKLIISNSNETHIEDLSSRNGVIINGLKIDKASNLPSGAVVSIGTTVFLFVDKEASEQTIYSPPPRFYEEETEPKTLEIKSGDLTEKNWKETFIPTKHLAIGSVFSVFFIIGLISLFSLFRSQTITPQHVDANKEIKQAIEHFQSVQYSYNPKTGKVFIIGHVLTDVDYAELNYLLKSLSFVNQVEDTVVVDEGVWQEMNALISLNPNWRGITMSATKPGHFVLRGYLQSESDAIPLQDYINLNFPYLNLLDNQVIVENTLQTEIENLLLEPGFTNVDLQLGNGEVILSGRVSDKRKQEFLEVVAAMQKIPGVRQVKTFVIYASVVSSLLDLSAKYSVMGSSRLGNMSQYVLIGGKILAVGDVLDGMILTSITPNEILLEKDGIKYKIDYNQQ